MTEATTALLFVLAAALLEPLHVAIGGAAFLALMLAIGLIDARHRIVPNKLVYPALVAFAVAIGVGDLLDGGVSFVSALIGMAAYSLPLFVVALIVPGGLGMGDVKLTALIGLVLGALGLSLVAVAAGAGILAGGLGAVIAMAVLRYGRKQHMPFGPFLALGAVVALLWGGSVAEAYLSLVGL
jgi:leader peptidase (prepilin peptidase)/N-methyltransferase